MIHSITEAFSMQPATFYVGGNCNGHTIGVIKEEAVYIDGDPFEYYVGYTEDGRKIFEFKKGTVNVFYN